jgi:hypothetical protein
MALKKLLTVVRAAGSMVYNAVGAVIRHTKEIFMTIFGVSLIGSCVTGAMVAAGIVCPPSLFPAFFMTLLVLGVCGDHLRTLESRYKENASPGEDKPLLAHD